MTDKFRTETKYWHKGEMFDIKGKVLNITHEEIKALEGGIQYTIELLVENEVPIEYEAGTSVDILVTKEEEQ